MVYSIVFLLLRMQLMPISNIKKQQLQKCMQFCWLATIDDVFLKPSTLGDVNGQPATIIYLRSPWCWESMLSLVIHNCSEKSMVHFILWQEVKENRLFRDFLSLQRKYFYATAAVAINIAFQTMWLGKVLLGYNFVEFTVATVMCGNILLQISRYFEQKL